MNDLPLEGIENRAYAKGVRDGIAQAHDQIAKLEGELKVVAGELEDNAEALVVLDRVEQGIPPIDPPIDAPLLEKTLSEKTSLEKTIISLDLMIDSRIRVLIAAEATLETMSPFLNRLKAVFDEVAADDDDEKEQHRLFDELVIFTLVQSTDCKDALDAYSAFMERKAADS